MCMCVYIHICCKVTVTSRDDAKLSPVDACRQCDKDTTDTQCITKKCALLSLQLDVTNVMIDLCLARKCATRCARSCF